MRAHILTLGGPVMAAALLLSSPALAQDTREATIAAEQARKAAALKPYVPSGAERKVLALKRELVDFPSGFYPYFASAYSGGGFTLGAGYRQFYGDRTHWDVKGLYSAKNYKFIELSTDSWGHAKGKVDLHVRTGWRDATQVAYYGLGIDTPDEAASNYRMKQGWFGGNVQMRPARVLVADLGATYEDFTLDQGTGPDPSIEEIFTPDTAPGLGVNPKYLHTYASFGLDSRPSAGYARHGGLYQVTYHNYADRDDTYSFDRVDGEVVQHIPILRENWVISLHGLVQTTLDDDDQVPYFLMPSLGSGSTLRGFSSWRFRDRHSLLLSGELRWIPNRLGLDMALFYDAGKVAPFWDGLSLDGMKSDVGIGVRFHSPLATPLRIDFAKGPGGAPHRLFRFGSVLITGQSMTTRFRFLLGAPRDPGLCGPAARGSARRLPPVLQRRPAAARARNPGRLEGRRNGRSTCSGISRRTCSGTPATRPWTCGRRTSTRSTRCPTPAGSPTASGRGR